jgi:thiol:disulfide interchange protein DsbD
VQVPKCLSAKVRADFWHFGILAATLLLTLLSPPIVRAQPPPPPAHLSPLLERDAIAPGQTIRAALKVTLPSGLHANSHKPRDPNLIPMVLTATPPEGVSVEEVVYPEPTDLKQQGAEQPLSVFEREFAIGLVLKIAAGTSAGKVVVPARLRYQACDDKLCYRPLTVETQWVIPLSGAGAAGAGRHADVFRTIRFGTGEAPSPSDADHPGLPAPMAPVLPNTQAVVAALDRFTVAGVGAGYMKAADFLQFIRNAEAGVVEKGWFEGRGPVAILLIVLIGGLALNLTPCVLPMIPINLAVIGAGAQASSRRRGFLLGATYGAAMAAVYGVLGVVVILSARTFGGINSSPWFNAGIAALFVLLALAMFDVISIDFSRYSSRFRFGEASRGTFLLAFTLGALAALLAGACVAPVVIQVVLFASDLYASGTTVALALPFLLGIGMAIPWPIAGAGIGALPKPGRWMVRVKQVFGVFILGTAFYYGYVAYGLFANRWVDADAVQSSVEEKLKEGWYSNIAAGIAAAERGGQPVLIDFWATWCKSCLTMDKTTLKDPVVTAALANYVKIKFQAENPDDPPASDFMKRFGAIGLPTYVILKPQASR